MLPALPAICLGTALLSAVLVRGMIRLAVLDTPGHRSAHQRPTPKGGGVGVLVGFLAGTGLALRLQGDAAPRAAACLLGGVALLGLVSWADDVRQFRPVVKLLAQATAAALVLWGLGALPVRSPLALAVAFGWLLFVTNALNFIDGLNGLAAGGMALACLCVGADAASGLLRTGSFLLAAGLLGFLPFNYPRARIFLGDVGSQGAGLAVAAFGLLFWQWRGSEAGAAGALAMPLLLLGVLYDVGFTLCRRWWAGARLSEAHRGHLYQVAFRSGMPAFAVTLLHWGFVLWGGAVAFALGAAALSLPLALGLALLPQLAWTALVMRMARTARLGSW